MRLCGHVVMTALLLVGTRASVLSPPKAKLAAWCGRRDAAKMAAIAAANFPALVAPASAATLLSNDDKVIRSARAPTAKVRALRDTVRAGGSSAASRVVQERETVLAPLQTAMAAGAPKLEYLTDAEYATAQALPLNLKGHLLELDEALRSDSGFVTYTSKTTGATYPGGKVEREVRLRFFILGRACSCCCAAVPTVRECASDGSLLPCELCAQNAWRPSRVCVHSSKRYRRPPRSTWHSRRNTLRERRRRDHSPRRSVRTTREQQRSERSDGSIVRERGR